MSSHVNNNHSRLQAPLNNLGSHRFELAEDHFHNSKRRLAPRSQTTFAVPTRSDKHLNQPPNLPINQITNGGFAQADVRQPSPAAETNNCHINPPGPLGNLLARNG